MEQRNMVQYNVENISSSLDKVKQEQKTVGEVDSMFAVTVSKTWQVCKIN